MKSRRSKAAVLATITAATFGFSIGDAHAIGRVTCGTRVDWFRIWNYSYTGELCFANSGYVATSIYSVDEGASGNNIGSWEDSYGTVTVFSGRYTTVTFSSPEYDVIALDIS